ncbi:MAG: hypothetical protein OWR62_12075 [Sulfobacillus thermotolerans]|nr:hypothetical protein [Sulfobacillus thermotolerans]
MSVSTLGQYLAARPDRAEATVFLTVGGTPAVDFPAFQLLQARDLADLTTLGRLVGEVLRETETSVSGALLAFLLGLGEAGKESSLGALIAYQPALLALAPSLVVGELADDGVIASSGSWDAAALAQLGTLIGHWLASQPIGATVWPLMQQAVAAALAAASTPANPQ